MIDYSVQYTVDDLAKYWKCSKSHIYLLIRTKKLRHLRIGNPIRIPIVLIVEYELKFSSKAKSYSLNGSEDKKILKSLLNFYYGIKKA